ncbi:hypothetical protein D5086_007669 [Populus alba]|uniref:Uncharacterized protein n=1 Tax=Populus alba TaxID=43335 RepID=A0ACC4CQK2_POPAL
MQLAIEKSSYWKVSMSFFLADNDLLANKFRTETNFSLGRFQLRLLDNGNLVLNSMNSPTKFAYDDYYRSGTSDVSNSSNSGYRLIFNESGYMYILRRNGLREDLTKTALPTTGFYRRATLNFDGNDKHGSCIPNFAISCKDNGKNSSEDLYDFVELRYVDYPSGNNCWKKKLPLSNGKVDSGFNGKTFIKFKKGDIPPGNPGLQIPETKTERDIKVITGIVLLAFLKFPKGYVPLDRSPPQLPGEKKKPDIKFITGSVVLGTSVFVNFVLVGAFCLTSSFIYRKKTEKVQEGGSGLETNLRYTNGSSACCYSLSRVRVGIRYRVQFAPYYHENLNKDLYLKVGPDQSLQ